MYLNLLMSLLLSVSLATPRTHLNSGVHKKVDHNITVYLQVINHGEPPLYPYEPVIYFKCNKTAFFKKISRIYKGQYTKIISWKFHQKTLSITAQRASSKKLIMETYPLGQFCK